MCGVPLWKRKKGFQSLSNKNFFSLLDKLHLKKNDQLIMSGGEPTVLSNFFDVCHRIKTKYPSKLIILSNGRRFANKKFTKQFSKIGVDRTIVPLFSDKAEIHDEITQKKGSFLETLRGLRNLNDLGLNLGIKFIALKLNYKDAKKVIEIILKEFPRHWTLFCGIQIEGEVFNNLKKTAVKHSLVAKEVEKAIDIADKKGYYASIHMVPMCLIDPYYWKNYSIGTYNEEVLAPDKKEIDENSEDNFKNKPSVCRTCLVKERCVWAWKGYSKLFGLEELKPFRSERG